MSNRSGIILLVILVCALGAVAGMKYYKYFKEDPAFCTMCHLTEEGYRSWEKSKHYTIICQSCHSMSTLEGNRLLMSYYIKGNRKVDQTHGRVTPWNACRECHTREAAQGSVTFRNSYGHARHVFMENVSCGQCHTGGLHEMRVDSAKCRKCHEDKLVHGMGTAGLSCLNCHNFTEKKEHFISSERCFGCHEKLPRTGIMSRLQCHECHHPHARLQFQSSDCLGNCHSSEIKVGQHKLHIEKSNLQCLDCHKPHTWEVKKANAKGLCDRCHAFKDPMKFIYFPTEVIIKR